MTPRKIKQKINKILNLPKLDKVQDLKKLLIGH